MIPEKPQILQVIDHEKKEVKFTTLSETVLKPFITINPRGRFTAVKPLMNLGYTIKGVL